LQIEIHHTRHDVEVSFEPDGSIESVYAENPDERGEAPPEPHALLTALEETREVLDNMATLVTTWADYAFWEERAAEVLKKWSGVVRGEAGPLGEDALDRAWLLVLPLLLPDLTPAERDAMHSTRLSISAARFGELIRRKVRGEPLPSGFADHFATLREYIAGESVDPRMAHAAVAALEQAVRGVVPAPPPEPAILPDTFAERAVQIALAMKGYPSRNVVVLTEFEASFIRQKYAERNAGRAVPAPQEGLEPKRYMEHLRAVLDEMDDWVRHSAQQSDWRQGFVNAVAEVRGRCVMRALDNPPPAPQEGP